MLGWPQIMKADEDVKMIKPDALVLVVKSTELFIGQFIKDAYNYTKQEKRKTVKFRDLEKVVRDIEVYDFLTTDENILKKGTEEPSGKRMRLGDGTEQPDPDDAMLGESDHDYWLPISNIKRVAKAKLNEVIPDEKVNLEATACVAIARAATIFISLITATALDTCGKRSTLMTDNIYQAIEEIEFDFAKTLSAIEDQARSSPAGGDAQKPPKKKKALSGFFRFSMEKRAEVKQINPDASVSECAKILGKLWRELTEAERLAYKETTDGAATTETAGAGTIGDEMAAIVGGGLEDGDGLEDENARRLAEANQGGATENDAAASANGTDDQSASGGLPDDPMTMMDPSSGMDVDGSAPAADNSGDGLPKLDALGSTDELGEGGEGGESAAATSEPAVAKEEGDAAASSSAEQAGATEKEGRAVAPATEAAAAAAAAAETDTAAPAASAGPADVAADADAPEEATTSA
eukprot:COSAG02_NODE_2910_length_7766_cov_5.844659_2_plen_466_part_00